MVGTELGLHESELIILTVMVVVHGYFLTCSLIFCVGNHVIVAFMVENPAPTEFNPADIVGLGDGNADVYICSTLRYTVSPKPLNRV